MVENKDVVIVGGGPAGLAAAITAGENDLKAIVFEKSNRLGGQINIDSVPPRKMKSYVLFNTMKNSCPIK